MWLSVLMADALLLLLRIGATNITTMMMVTPPGKILGLFNHFSFRRGKVYVYLLTKIFYPIATADACWIRCGR